VDIGGSEQTAVVALDKSGLRGHESPQTVIELLLEF